MLLSAESDAEKEFKKMMSNFSFCVISRKKTMDGKLFSHLPYHTGL